MRPAWAEEITEKYVAGESSMFLLHGNVADVFLFEKKDGNYQWLQILEALETILAKKEIICFYDITTGFKFPNQRHQKAFLDLANSERKLRNEATEDKLPRTPTKALALIEDVVSSNTKNTAVILNYIEALAPAGDIASMGVEERQTCLTLHRWASDKVILNTDNIVIMIGESLSEINRKLLSATSITSINIIFPDLATRLAFILNNAPPNTLEITPEQFAKITAGLRLMQIGSMIKTADMSGKHIGYNDVSYKKKHIIEQECQGLVEFIPPNYTFDHVGGVEGIKTGLRKVADDIKHGSYSRVPMGMIFVGPMGTGKTFVAEAFATESGLTCIKLKNFRDKWVGATEANLEKVLDLVEALGNVLLVIDEADRGLSSGGSDDAVGSRVIARLKEFMSNTAHRGKVIILMMTNRPDKLDVDLKRPGRFDYKIPFFFPETVQERIDIFKAITRKHKITINANVDFTSAAEKTNDYSSAELEAIVLAALSKLERNQPDELLQEHLDASVEEIIPSRDQAMLDYMEILAVFECSSRAMLPDRYRDLSKDEIRSRLASCRAKITSRL
jgi:SpoVK/Ycf46/Vps4 family AAA+-type ATPase